MSRVSIGTLDLIEIVGGSNTADTVSRNTKTKYARS